MAESMQFTAGDIIQDFEEPFLKYLQLTRKKWFCNCCFKGNNRCLQGNQSLRRCSGCKKVFYCDSKCQKMDWKIAHSIECKLIANSQFLKNLMDGGYEDMVFRVVRLVAFLKLHESSARKSFQLYNGSQRCFNDLQVNNDEISKNPNTSQTLNALAAILKDSKLFSTSECSYENLVRMQGIWKINAFHTSNAECGIIGDAIYVLGSAFEHSCRPNALRVVDDSYRTQIRCIEAIPLGESPKIGYFNNPGICTRKARQHTLMWFFGFHCECVLCESEKVAPVVDYEVVLKVLGSFYREKIYGNDQLLIVKSVLTELEKIYCKYDARITNLYDYTLENMVTTLQGPHAFMVSIPQLNEFAKQAEENIRITYGIDHAYYKFFVEEIAPKLQQAS